MITRLGSGCWVLVDAAGKPSAMGSEFGVSHLHSETDAVRRADSYAHFRPEEPRLRAVRLLDGCWVATAECGYRFDEYGNDREGVVHEDTEATLRECLAGAGWILGPAGVLRCSAFCDECPDVPELVREPVGQLTLPVPDIRDHNLVVAGG